MAIDKSKISALSKVIKDKNIQDLFEDYLENNTDYIELKNMEVLSNYTFYGDLQKNIVDIEYFFEKVITANYRNFFVKKEVVEYFNNYYFTVSDEQVILKTNSYVFYSTPKIVVANKNFEYLLFIFDDLDDFLKQLNFPFAVDDIYEYRVFEVDEKYYMKDYANYYPIWKPEIPSIASLKEIKNYYKKDISIFDYVSLYIQGVKKVNEKVKEFIFLAQLEDKLK